MTCRAYFFARHMVVPPTPNTPVRSDSLLYYLRLEDSGSTLGKLTIPLCVNGFHGPEERVYDVILCASLAGWSEERPYAQNVVDLVLILRAMAREDPAVSAVAVAQLRRRIITITQYARNPQPTDQTDQLRELLQGMSRVVNIDQLRHEGPDFGDEDSVHAIQEVRDVWRVVSRGTQVEQVPPAIDQDDTEGPTCISGTVKTALGIQRLPEVMWDDPRLYATHSLDPRELEDIVLDRSSLPRPITLSAEPRVTIVMPYDPTLSGRHYVP
ncbi:hypothetical protein K466DRAFT_603657 [Polyporus arcularius HHB13444]|uniref:Uncharacterized protein n=1 Tax=Polyporus arcularius HHB13444 TaxID=1314778 RepID=A0A5C3P0C7_9APHY|nr:hypothetical protein K466DRAFT_603657 [Polyporus arcularius HHB13444]